MKSKTKGLPSLGPLAKAYLDEVGQIMVERDQLLIPVMVKDVRHSYGNAQFLVEPVHGTGECWKNIELVRFEHLPQPQYKGSVL